ncbi:MAG: nickel-responsive transcriptional regulator NikR [Burkholderiaceae bacterium]
MERFTISLDDKLAHEFDALIATRGYATRSEAVRDLIRAELERMRQQQDAKGQCIACLSYVFNHHELDLADRITTFQHEHHDLTVSTMHAHLDHDHCIETVILKGKTTAVRAFADALCAERGVHHGNVNLIGVDAHEPHAKSSIGGRGTAAHGHSHGIGAHRHVKPKT